MKNIILISFILIHSVVNGQNLSFNEDSITKFFVESLDSIRDVLYPNIDKIIINDNINNACVHHNNFMSKMVKTNSAFISHTECKTGIGFTYTGKDTIIPSYIDRVKYYNVENDFVDFNEVISFEYYSYWKNQNVTDEFMASVFINNFMSSPDHKKILTGSRYTSIGIDVYIDNEKMYITVITGGIVEKINDKEYSVSLNKTDGVREIKVFEYR